MFRTCFPSAVLLLALTAPATAFQTGSRPDPGSQGYRWLNPDDQSDYRIVWTPGSRDRRNPNIHAGKTKDKWIPDPGYDWLTDKEGDLRVRWVPGRRHTDFPNDLAAAKERTWQAAPGYRWASQDAKDLRVVRDYSLVKSVPTARTADEAKQRAVGKIIGAFLLHAGGSGTTDDPGAAFMKALALKLRDELVESALKDFNPALKDYEVRAARRVICLLLEEKLTARTFTEVQLREELIEQMKKSDPRLGAAGELADFMVSVNRAWNQKKK